MPTISKKKRKFYWCEPDSTRRPPGLIFENEEKLCLPGTRVFGMGNIRIRGFPPMSEPPLFRYSKEFGRKPLDLELELGYWIVSRRTKEVFEATDPDAFIFVACKTIIEEVEAVGDFWLCDVVRILDALDEPKTNPIVYENGSRHYGFIGFENLYFQEDIVGQSHVFRMMYSWSNVICDERLRSACKNAGLKGLIFRPAIQRASKNTSEVES